MLLFFTIIFQGGIIILYRRKSVFQTSIIYFVTNNSKISQVIYESN